MQKTCTQCQQMFEISDSDQQFYDQMDVVVPDFCPACRMQRRILFRNFFNLYHRKCDLTGKQIISMYHQDTVFPVYEMHEWWGDKWDGKDFGIEIDWSKSVFDHLRPLHQTVPRMAIMNTQTENTDYCNLSFRSRNCYLVFGNVFNEDCYYGHIVWQSQNCYDCLYTYRSQWCYQCVDCVQCHNVAYCVDAQNCSDSKFLVNCSGCRDCFGCVGLKNKQYCFFNEQLTKEEYEKRLLEFNSGSRRIVELAQKKVQELVGNHTVKNYHGFNNENVSGDYLYNCKNTFDSFDAKNCEDCRYLATAESFVNAHDCNYSPDKTEWAFNCVAVTGNNLLCCHTCTSYGSDLKYCDNCYACRDCFGCVGLKSQRYCIFNKQYSKEEYQQLLPRLIDKMKQEGTYGEFTPPDCSPFAYNQTMAHQYFPLSREEVLERGWRWKEGEETAEYQGQIYEVPDDIQEVPDDLPERVLICELTGKPFKVIKQELAFYRRMNLPVPTKSWEQRHKERMELKNPRKLIQRPCDQCRKEVLTTYFSERPERVICEECYLVEIS